MKKVLALLLICLSSTMLFAQSQDPHWTPNMGPYANSMTINAVLIIDGVEGHGNPAVPDYWSELELGAFSVDDGECRGTVYPPLYRAANDQWIFMLTVWGNDHDYVNFKVYNHATSTEMDLTCLHEDVEVIVGTSIGKPKTPHTIEFVSNSSAESYTLEIDANTWYLIASPIAQNVGVEDVTNLLADDFDLYYFDQSGEGDDTHEYLEWINYKQADETHPFTSLVPNKGYLYANTTGDDLIFTGTAIDPEEVESVEVDLDYEDGVNLPGLNLIGNPYAVNAVIDWEDYLVMEDGELQLANREGDYPYVYAMEGFFVEAEEAEQTVVFEPDTEGVTGSGQNPGGGGGWTGKLNLRVSDNNGRGDLARIRFGQGHGLTKYMINPENTKIYFPMDNADYAVVYAENMGEMPVNFKASANGTYTLSFTNYNVEFGYLHLIDNMNGNDVDLLANPSYSFEASTTDYASRFKLVFATGNADDSFAFYSNGSFVISNEGNATLQVVDVTGRILKSETINGCANVNVNAAPGVYMLRLINGNNVKVQKVVVK